MFRFAALTTVLVVRALAAPAAPTAFELNMDRVKASTFGGSLASPSKTYFVPAVTLMVSASGSIWAQSKTGGANAQAHAKFYVKGLEKTVLQDLARKIQDDLVTKLRAAGYTVLTFEDLKAAPLLANHGRLKDDAKWNLPTTTKNPLTYVVAAPSDAQALERPINGPVFWLKDLAKEKDLVVLAQEITFEVPVVYGETGGGYKRAEASVALKPVMRLKEAMVWAVNGKGGTANIQVQEHGTRLVAENVGAAKKLSEDTTNFSASWGRSSADYLFALDQAVFSDGVVRAGTQLNDMIVSQIAKAKK